MATASENAATIRGLEHVLLGRSLSYDLRPPMRCPHRGEVTWDMLPYEQAQKDVARANLDRTRRRHLSEPSPISEPEIVLLAALRFYGEHPLLQHPVGPYDLDFLIADYQAAIEVDGCDFHDPISDARRDRRVLETAGIRTYRVPARDVFKDPLWCVRVVCKDIIRDRREQPCPTC